jgi:hypothetical protein
MGKPGLDPGAPTCHESHACPVHLPDRLQPRRPHLFECDPARWSIALIAAGASL